MKWSLALATWMHSPTLCPKLFGVEVVGQMSCRRVGPGPELIIFRHLPNSQPCLKRRVLIMFHIFSHCFQWVSLWNHVLGTFLPPSSDTSDMADEDLENLRSSFVLPRCRELSVSPSTDILRLFQQHQRNAPEFKLTWCSELLMTRQICRNTRLGA